MSNCIDCGTPVRSGSRCRMHALEHQHGTLGDRRDTCTVCGATIARGAPTTTVDGGPAHVECKGQLRCDGGQRHTDLPTPDRFFQAIGDGEVDMEVRDHDDVQFRTNHVPGGRFCLELIASYSYAGRDCRQHISLTRESAEALRDHLDDVLATDSRGDR